MVVVEVVEVIVAVAVVAAVVVSTVKPFFKDYSRGRKMWSLNTGELQ